MIYLEPCLFSILDPFNIVFSCSAMLHLFSIIYLNHKIKAVIITFFNLINILGCLLQAAPHRGGGEWTHESLLGG